MPFHLPHYLGNSLLFRGFEYAAGFVAGWAGLYLRRWQKSRGEQRAQSWPTVQGRILSGEAKPIPKTNRQLVTLIYSYFVDEYYSGKYMHEFANEDEANAFAREMRDKLVLIRYKDGKPSVSLLEESIVQQTAALVPKFG